MSSANRNTLKFDSRYKLMKFIEAHQENFSKTHMTKFAKDAEQILGFTVSLANVDACRKDLGLPTPSIPRESLKKESGRSPDRGYVLAKYIVKLYEELGLSVGDDLLRIASKKKSS